METKVIIKGEETTTVSSIDVPKLNKEDPYGCITCPYNTEILKINDGKNTL